MDAEPADDRAEVSEGGQERATVTAFRGTASPQLARAVKASENVWKDIESEYGMLTSMDVALLIGSKSSSRSIVEDKRAAGELIGVKRGNGYVYPGFQFGRGAREVHPGIPALITVVTDVGWDQEDLVLWLVLPSGYFGGDRPVDHLDDVDLADKARLAATVEW